MKLKNYNKIVEQTSPEVKEKVSNWMDEQDKLHEKGGFVKYEPIKEEKECTSNKHNPPGYIVLKPGKHIYKCPSCGEETIVNIPKITL